MTAGLTFFYVSFLRPSCELIISDAETIIKSLLLHRKTSCSVTLPFVSTFSAAFP